MRSGAGAARRPRADRPLPREDHVPALRRARAGARLRRAGAAARRPAEVPELVRQRRLPQERGRCTGSTSPAPPAARAGRVVLVEGYTDAVALRQAGVAEVVGLDGDRVDRPPGRPRSRVSRRRRCSARTRTPPARRRSRAASRALRDVNRVRAGRGVEFRIVRLPPGSDPADVVQRDGADSMRALLERAVPIARFEVERALEVGDTTTTDGRDQALAAAAAAIRPLPPSVLREELVQLVAGRLGLTESLVAAVLAGEAPLRVSRPAREDRPGGGERCASGARPPRAERAGLPRLLPRAARGGRGAARLRRPRRAVLRPRHPPRRRVPARPPAVSGRRAAGRRRAARPVGRRARHPRGTARGHARQARARGPPARPPQPRPPHRDGPHRRPRAHPRPRRRAPAGARRDPPPPQLARAEQWAPEGWFRPATRTSVRVMEAPWLASQLDAGRSIESIAREAGLSPSTVAYWVNKHGLTSQHAERHRARGGLTREQLEPLVEAGVPIRAMAEQLGVSYTTVRHWLRRHGLQTVRAARLSATADARASGAVIAVASCRRHGPTAFGRSASGHYRCLKCRSEAVAARRRRVKERLVEAAGGCCRPLRLQPVCGRTPVPPYRSGSEVIRHRRSWRRTFDRSRAGGGAEVRSPVRHLSCRGRGGDRYTPGNRCRLVFTGSSFRGSSIWQMRPAVNRKVVGSSPTPGALGPLPPLAAREAGLVH